MDSAKMKQLRQYHVTEIIRLANAMADAATNNNTKQMRYIMKQLKAHKKAFDEYHTPLEEVNHVQESENDSMEL